MLTSMIGFLPVHAVAVRRAARRNASRNLSSLLSPSDLTVAASFSRTSSRKASRSSSTGTPCAVTTGAAASRSEEHTSELQSLMRISYAVFCLKKKTNTTIQTYTIQKYYATQSNKIVTHTHDIHVLTTS